MRSLSIAIVVVVLSASFAQGTCENQQANEIWALECNGEIIHWVEVKLEGEEAEKLDKVGLERFVLLRLKNDLSMLKFEIRSVASVRSEVAKSARLKYMQFPCHIWTMSESGKAYPIAFYVECHLEGFAKTKSGVGSYKHEFLGIANRESLESGVRTSIQGIVETVAEEFINMRDKAAAFRSSKMRWLLPPKTK